MAVPPQNVTGNDATDEELWGHRLTFDDAYDVWLGPAKYFTQPARPGIDEHDNPRRQPERMLMIGPDLNGRLLTFVLELPDSRGISHVVTGWVSDNHEQSRYHQPGGRLRIR